MKTNRNSNKKEPDLLDILLDAENFDPILLSDVNGHMAEFEQVAVIPLGGEIYCLLTPIGEVEGVGEDDIILFKVVTDRKGESSLEIVFEKDIIDKIFAIYDKMFDDAKKGKR